MKTKQIEHEKTHTNRVQFNKYKPYLIGGGVLIAGILFMKIYRSFLATD